MSRELAKIMELGLLDLDGDFVVGYNGVRTDDSDLYQALLWARMPKDPLHRVHWEIIASPLIRFCSPDTLLKASKAHLTQLIGVSGYEFVRIIVEDIQGIHKRPHELYGEPHELAVAKRWLEVNSEEAQGVRQ